MPSLQTRARIRPALLIFVAHFSVAALAHNLDASTASFLITGESRDTVVVRLPQQKAKCTFEYVAGQPVTQKKTSEEKTSVRVEDVLQRLSGQCARGQSGYWTYEVCLGGTIRQFHGADSYMLGRFHSVAGKILKYDNGLPCEPPVNPQERKVDVSLACSHALGIQLISEPSTCVYTMTLTTPEVCSDPSFPKLMNPTGNAGGPAPDDGHEDWILQIRDSGDDEIVCSAFSTELKLAGSRLSFGSFSLKMESESTSKLRIKSGRGRRMGRVPLGASEMSLGRDSVTHGQDFSGKMAFVELTGDLGGGGSSEAAEKENSGSWF